jgi:ABC-2 type transport system ATP-binding protein
MTDTPGMAVRLDGLTKSFGPVRAVRGVDLDIAPGEVVALLGPNGAGKSTTIDMLLGLARPDHGSARLFGREPQAAVSEGLVGAMLQAGTILPDVAVGELVDLFGSLHKRPIPVEEALERAGIADLAKRPTAKLSGGQVQRVRFALAVVTDPELLVLDEPTVAMDVEARRSFWAQMHALTAAGRTVLFATHYLAEADEYADRVVLMREGSIVADGTSAEIKSRVAGRSISATFARTTPRELAELPGVDDVREGRNGRTILRCDDSDLALRAMLARYPDARDIEVESVDLEEAFLALTGSTSSEKVS